ncbi:hypothetical protein F5Y12DRAFT_741950 [Xylaria sp. FL1777]|nr:hypothetical protein F5Y12DRAFT_741950 [Xylaria sp. FL1777]
MPRKPFRARPYQPNVGNPDVPVFSRGTILDNGLIGEKPPTRKSFETSIHVPDPAETENDLYALNSLQLRRGWPLEPLSVQIPIEYLHDNLPPGARKLVGIAMCGSTYVFNCREEDEDRRIRKMYRRWPGFWNIFRTSEYVFWPIEAEKGYFVTAIFHMEKGMMDDPDFDSDDDPDADIPQVPNPEFGIVGAWSVVDGQRGADGINRLLRVRRRIRRIFACEGIKFNAESFMEYRGDDGERWNEPWVPRPSPGEDWSSGIRSFALVRQLIQRVLDLYCHQMEYDDDFFHEPTCGWINVDQVRYEMMGICAINVIEDMDWNARLAVECIQRITTVEGYPSFQARFLAPYDNDKEAYIPESDISGFPIPL